MVGLARAFAFDRQPAIGVVVLVWGPCYLVAALVGVSRSREVRRVSGTHKVGGEVTRFRVGDASMCVKIVWAGSSGRVSRWVPR